MGQNQTPTNKQSYQSKDFFQKQVELYRWRADESHNSHICRVTFHIQQSIKDREMLKSFLEIHYAQGRYISLNDLLKLASQNNNSSKEELMTFQNYVCTLSDLEEKLTLVETLYVIHALFSGFESILAKISKLKASLDTCFVTKEGEVRAWFNPDFKSNDFTNEINEYQRDNPLITSEIGMIKRILEFGQKLVNIHTDFLHFTRQFKSYMERDILQNWTFANARKLINSYVYTYRLKLPSNLKQLLRKYQRSITNSSFSEAYNSPVISHKSSFVQSNCLSNKSELVETGPSFIKKMSSNPSSGRNQYVQRPISYSDWSSKKSEELVQHPSKTHSKKYASTDLKNFYERGKKGEPSKMMRSDMLSQHSSKSEPRKKRQISGHSNTSNHKIRKEQQCASIDVDTKMNTTAPYTPNNHSLMMNGQNLFQQSSRYYQDKIKMKESSNSGILKQNQYTKQKKKLEKKAAVVSKYISFSQQTKQPGKNDISAPEISNSSVQQFSQEKCHHGLDHPRGISQHSRKQNIPDSAFPQSHKVSFGKRQVSMQQQFSSPFNISPMISRKASFENTPKTASVYTSPFIGKTEYFRSYKEEESSDNSQMFSNHNKCCTIKTFNKLVDNNEVSIHESIGSFSSVEQNEGSEYQGMLTKMGRSVDIAPKGHCLLQKKPISTSNNFKNKS